MSKCFWLRNASHGHSDGGERHVRSEHRPRGVVQAARPRVIGRELVPLEGRVHEPPHLERVRSGRRGPPRRTRRSEPSISATRAAHVLVGQELEVQPHAGLEGHAPRDVGIEAVGLEGQDLHGSGVGEVAVGRAAVHLPALRRPGVDPAEEAAHRHGGAHHLLLREVGARVAGAAHDVEEVAAARGPQHRLVRGLGDGTGVRPVAPEASGQRAPASRELLVHHRLDEQVAAEAQARLPESHRHRGLRGEAALHVPAPAPVQPPPADRAGERAAGPGLVAGRDRVDVPAQEEAPSPPRPGQARDEVVAAAVAPVPPHEGMARAREEADVVELHVDAVASQGAGQDLLGRGLVAVRRDGHAVHAHERLGESDDFAAERPQQPPRVAGRGGRRVSGHGGAPSPSRPGEAARSPRRR